MLSTNKKRERKREGEKQTNNKNLIQCQKIEK